MREPKPGQLYRHFKGMTVRILALAKDSETLEEMIVYSHEGKGDEVWVRSKEMFLSKVDHEKYPDVKQDYRFDLIER